MVFRSLPIGFVFASVLSAQSPSVAASVVSPEVRPDRTVVFRIFAPKAGEVALYGDWMPVGRLEPMIKGEDAVWSITAGPIDATGHLYWFNVDGMVIADPVNPRVKLRQRTSASVVEVPASPPAAWDLRDVEHGVVTTEWRKSPVLNRTERFVIYLPPGYGKSSARYPVLYLIHGTGDVPESWTNAGNANFILDNLIADGRATPMIVVMPAGHAAPFTSGRAGPNNAELFETYLLKDLIPAVESTYRVAPGPKNRALAGLSMGGALTVAVGFSHPEMFSALGIFSAGGGPNFESRFAKALADAEDTNAKLGLIWAASGDRDTVVPYAGVKQWVELLRKLGIHARLRTIEGGAHTWPVWRLCLAEFAPMLFHTAKQ